MPTDLMTRSAGALAAGLVDDVGETGFGEGVSHGFHESQINSLPWHDNGGG